MSVQRLADLLRLLDVTPTEEDILDVLFLASVVGAPKPATVGVVLGSVFESRVMAWAKSDPDPELIRQAAERKQVSEPRLAADRRIEPLRDANVAHSLHPIGAATTGTQRATLVRAPAAAALGDKLALGRALRPMKRPVPSHRRCYMDEVATANQIAEGRFWTPVLRPAPARWLELAVVVDGYESMSIWRDVVAEFRGVLEGLGAFSDVRFWLLDRIGGDSSRPGLRRWAHGSTPRSPGELTDPAGRRAIVVLSDCLGPLWRSGAAQRQLAIWGASQPVTIVQPLPQRLWTFTHAPPIPADLRAARPGSPNAQLHVLRTRPRGAAAPRAVPIPVVELDPDWLAGWSRLVSASGTAGVSMMALFTRHDLAVHEQVQVTESTPRDAHWLVQRFRASASPEAFNLAVYLTAAPITLPVIRVVQRVMLGSSRQSQVAEVFLGGLLRRQDEEIATDPDAVQYEFVTNAVRDLLVRRLRRTDALRVLHAASDFLDVRFGQARDFRALLAGQGIAGDYLITSGSKPFALVAERILRLLGGQYLAPANQLAVGLGNPDSAVGPAAVAAAEAPPVPIPRSRSKERPLACPYCYHAFAAREILFRCAGRADIDGVACEPRRDQVLEKQMRQSASLLPPVFSPEKSTDEATCPWCQQRTRIQVCPSCHTRLPATFMSVEGRLIALAGPSLAGKTAFMTVLLHELRHAAGERLNAWATGADDTTNERFARQYESTLYRKSLLFPRTTTSGQDYIAPLVFCFTMNQRTLLRRRPQELLLSFADGAGEDLISPRKVELMRRYLAAADGVVALIDPLQLPAARAQLGSAVALPPLLSPDQLSAFVRITELLRAGFGGTVVDKPVAIVLTKIDTLWSLLPPDSALRRPEEVSPFFDVADSIAVQQEVTSLLAGWGAGEIVDLARKHYSSSRFFAVSSLGAQPTDSNRVSAHGIHPYRITDPFLWLLSEFKFIETVRRALYDPVPAALHIV
jgi:Double-GTPase 2